MGESRQRLMEVTLGKVNTGQGGFSKGKDCMDQIFAIKVVRQEYTGKGKRLHVAFMDLEKQIISLIGKLSVIFWKSMVGEGNYWKELKH